MATNGVGLYIHIPFCRSKCKYCDFKSFSNINEDIRGKYIDRLIGEIREYSGQNIAIKTIFFGGGTPSLLTANEMQKIVNSVDSVFDVSKDVEFTIEANPKTIDEEKLRVFKSLGVNRISVGLQTIHEKELKMLGRIHSYDDFLTSYDAIKRVGIDNINVDLMYGIPYQTLSSLDKTLDSVISLNANHISAYGLIIEEGTPFFDMKNSLSLPGEDEEILMYELIAKRLSQNGYGHYEISNYARDGYECQHNLIYWRDEEYIGLGLSAHSYIGNTRYSNPASVDEYLFADLNSSRDYVRLDREDVEFEYAMMNLRLNLGISLSEYEEKFSISFLDGREEKINKYIKLGLLARDKDRIFLTERGFYLSNTILSDLL